MRPTSIFLLASSATLLSGCAGPMGPPLGLGPELDSLVCVLFFCLIGLVLWKLLRLSRETRSSKHGDARAGSGAETLLRER